MNSESLRPILVDLYNAESGTEMNEKQAVDQAISAILALRDREDKNKLTMNVRLCPFTPESKILTECPMKAERDRLREALENIELVADMKQDENTIKAIKKYARKALEKK